MEEPASKRRVVQDEAVQAGVEALLKTVTIAWREMTGTQSEEEVARRTSELTARGLDDASIAHALEQRRLAVEQLCIDEGRQLADAVVVAKVNASMLQLHKVLLRRRLAVIQGRPLPPLDSVFARVPR